MLSRRVFRVATAALAVLAPVAFPLVAEGKVELDPTFGRGGKVAVGSVQAQQATGARVVEDSRGRLVLGVGSSVRRYLANGKLDRDFGSDGQITVAPPGGAPFSLGGLAVDPQGRVLIAGGLSNALVSADLELFDPAARVSVLGGAMVTMERTAPDGLRCESPRSCIWGLLRRAP